MATDSLSIFTWKGMDLYPLPLNLGSLVKVILCGFQDWAIYGHAACTLSHGTSVPRALKWHDNHLTNLRVPNCEETQAI